MNSSWPTSGRKNRGEALLLLEVRPSPRAAGPRREARRRLIPEGRAGSLRAACLDRGDDMDVHSSAEQLPADIQGLFDAVVAHPSGVQLLRQGHLESVSMLFGAHPAVVDEVRGWLSSGPQRKVVAEALSRARHRRPATASRSAPRAPVPRSPSTPQELRRAVLEVPGGEELLAQAPLETVAIIFGVRPALVAQARDLEAVRT